MVVHRPTKDHWESGHVILQQVALSPDVDHHETLRHQQVARGSYVAHHDMSRNGGEGKLVTSRHNIVSEK